MSIPNPLFPSLLVHPQQLHPSFPIFQHDPPPLYSPTQPLIPIPSASFLSLSLMVPQYFVSLACGLPAPPITFFHLTTLFPAPKSIFPQLPPIFLSLFHHPKERKLKIPQTMKLPENLPIYQSSLFFYHKPEIPGLRAKGMDFITVYVMTHSYVLHRLVGIYCAAFIPACQSNTYGSN